MPRMKKRTRGWSLMIVWLLQVSKFLVRSFLKGGKLGGLSRHVTMVVLSIHTFSHILIIGVLFTF